MRSFIGFRCQTATTDVTSYSRMKKIYKILMFVFFITDSSFTGFKRRFVYLCTIRNQAYGWRCKHYQSIPKICRPDFASNRHIPIGISEYIAWGDFLILWKNGFWATFANIIKSLQRIEILWMMVWYLSSFPSKAKNIIYITTCNETFSSFLFRASTKMLKNVCASIHILLFMQIINSIFSVPNQF